MMATPASATTSTSAAGDNSPSLWWLWRWRSAITVRARPVGLRAAEAAAAAREVGDGERQRLAREVGPVHVGQPKFRVGHLVEQKIRQARFTAGPDEQVRVRQIARVQVVPDGVLVDG